MGFGAAAAAETEAPAPGSSWQIGLRSTGYVTQTQGPSGDASQFQGFQLVSGSATGLGGGRFSFRGTGRLANEPDPVRFGFETSRLYNGYAEARLSRGLKARLGRQFVLSGTGSLTLDGGWLSWRPSRRTTVEGWAGARTPFGHAFEIGDFDQDAALGGRVAWQAGRRLRTALSVAQNKRGGEVAQRLLGVELSGAPGRRVSAFSRVIYDQENGYWNRLQAQLRWRPGSGPSSLTLQAVDRRPFIDPSSYFARFADVERVRVLRASLRLEKASGVGAEFDAFGSFIDDRSASRLALALLLPGARVGWSQRLGDSGEESRFYGEVARQVRPWLWAELGATFQTYALLTDAPADDERDLTTFSARVRARLRPGLRLTAEIQSLDNPIYSKDVRFLCGVDLARSGGAAPNGGEGWQR